LTLQQAVDHAVKQLSNIIEGKRKEAEYLLRFFLDQENESLYLLRNGDQVLENSEAYFQLITRRNDHEPVEYITNRVSFFSQTFFIDHGALIPRPETELLIEYIVKRLDKQGTYQFCEIGVGSGIISIVLAQHFPNASFIATDISEDALKIAQKNIDLFTMGDRIELRLSSLLDKVNEPIDILVSNPPYIANDEQLEKNLDYEPDTALFGGVVGDELLKEIVDLAHKRKVKMLACEMGYDQKEPMQAYISGHKSLEFYQDYANLDRGFIVEYSS
jgi:release factor glutamine methyltransferase